MTRLAAAILAGLMLAGCANSPGRVVDKQREPGYYYQCGKSTCYMPQRWVVVVSTDDGDTQTHSVSSRDWDQIKVGDRWAGDSR